MQWYRDIAFLCVHGLSLNNGLCFSSMGKDGGGKKEEGGENVEGGEDGMPGCQRRHSKASGFQFLR